MISTSNISCRDLIGFIMAYESDDLPARQRQQMDQHLENCKDCRDYLDTYHQTVQLSKAVHGTVWVPSLEEFPEELLQIVVGLNAKQDLCR